MRDILIYRNDLLPLSETFILAQARALCRYRPQFLGRRIVKGGLLECDACLLTEHYSILPEPLRTVGSLCVGTDPIFYRKKLMRLLQASLPALIHAHFVPDAIAAAPLARALHVPLIVTLHGYDVTARNNYRDPLRPWLHARQLTNLWRNAALFLCVSDFIRDRAIDAGFPAEKIQVHHIGIDIEHIVPVAPERAVNDIIFVGRLTEKKGCMYLIHAMKKVQQEMPAATLLILGEGSQRVQLEALAADLEVRCSFLGAQTHQQVIHYLRHSRICAIPSVTAANGDSEGLPMILSEAQALGVPVVGTRHAGIPEGIVDGQTGLLSEERDADGMARNLLRLLQDKPLHAEIRQNGIELAQRQFNLCQQTDTLESLYDAVLSAVPSKTWCNACATL